MEELIESLFTTTLSFCAKSTELLIAIIKHSSMVLRIVFIYPAFIQIYSNIIGCISMPQSAFLIFQIFLPGLSMAYYFHRLHNPVILLFLISQSGAILFGWLFQCVSLLHQQE